MTRGALAVGVLVGMGGPLAADCLSQPPIAARACVEAAVDACFEQSQASPCLQTLLTEASRAVDGIEQAIVTDVSGDVPRLPELMAADRAAWEVWRDATCARKAAMDFAVPGGTWELACALDMTVNRWHRLSALPDEFAAWP